MSNCNCDWISEETNNIQDQPPEFTCSVIFQRKVAAGIFNRRFQILLRSNTAFESNPEFPFTPTEYRKKMC